ncbi:MAG: tyrosine-type recombinase/integrase [Puniceicoccales bacterium]|jgi:integrase|nr:tyrosine-type recombinase/integrase [Puniceicoccales bacterium]
MKKGKINFTKAAILAIKPPGKGYIIYCDAQEKGLCLRVLSTGSKTFIFQKFIEGKIARIVIAPFPDITVDEARKRVQEMKGQLAGGKNPLKEKEKLADEKTFGEAYELFMEKYAKIENRVRTQKDMKSRLKKVLPHWSHRYLSSISRYEMQEMHARIGQEHGKIEANRVFSYIRTIYNKMIGWGWEGKNPATGIQKFKEQKRDRFILHDELPKFMEALEMEPNRAMRDFFLMCLYTGARCGNVLSMRWEDIDFSIREWRIPDTKNGEPVRIPLIEEALEILENRSWLKGSSIPWVFPSNDSKSGCLVSPQKAWKRILDRAGLKNLRIHDLRRTLGSYQAIAGASLTIIGKSLGHKSPQSTAIYARLSNDPVRASMTSAFDFYRKGKEVNNNMDYETVDFFGGNGNDKQENG